MQHPPGRSPVFEQRPRPDPRALLLGQAFAADRHQSVQRAAAARAERLFEHPELFATLRTDPVAPAAVPRPAQRAGKQIEPGRKTEKQLLHPGISFQFRRGR